MVIGCELCGSPANTYCESDRARLCWACDAKVHGANFLVAKHTRTLLCHHCQAQTPWAASGPKLTPSMSFCLSCLSSQAQAQHSPHQLTDPDHDDADGDVDGISFEYDDDDHSQTLSGDDDDDDDDEENQVVPWASSPPTSNGSEAEDCNNNGGLLKRKREIAFLHTPSGLVRF